MLLAQVEAFLEVARRGSVSRAAEVLFVTQPALTARIHALEQELGAELFVRTRQGMRLTEAGRAFMPHAERATGALREGVRALEAVRSGAEGHLVLAAAPAVSTYLLPPILQRFSHDHPKVDVTVRTGHSEDVLRMVLRDEVQLGLGRALNHPEIEATRFSEDELVLVVPPDHPFSARRSVSLPELASEQLILFDRTSSYYELTNGAFLSAGVSPRTVMELDNIEAAKKMVAGGLGYAFLPRTAVAGEVSDRRLARVAVSGIQPLRRSIVAMRRRDSGPPSGPVASFMSLLLEEPGPDLP